MSFDQQNVIDKTTKVVKRWGFCDFENDGSYQPDVEEIIEKAFLFDPDIDETTWLWDSELETFVEEGA